MKRSMIIVPMLALLGILAVTAAAPAQIAEPPRTAMGYLEAMLKDPKTANSTVAALRSSNDPALVPLFETPVTSSASG